MLSGSLIKKVVMPPGAVSLDDIDLDQVSVDYVLNCVKKGEMLELSEAIRDYHDSTLFPRLKTTAYVTGRLKVLDRLLVRPEMQRHTSKVLEKEGLKRASIGGDQEQPIELKFRIYDGTDIGHRTYLPSTIVANLKQQLIDEWPQGKSVTHESINHVKLIHGGKVLVNFKSLAESKVAYQGSPRVITMHVVVNTHSEYARAGSESVMKPAKVCKGRELGLWVRHHLNEEP